MDIVVLDGYTENPGDLSWGGFEALGRLTVYDRSPVSDEAEVIRRIGGAEAVLTNKTPLGAAVFAACPALRYVGVLATGYNVVDLAAAKAAGAVVTNIPTYGTMAVAQFTFALLLEICHGVGHHSRAVHAGRWAESPDFCFWDSPLMELDGKTMGLIGFGRIGRAVGRIAAAFGMRVLAYDAAEQPAPDAAGGGTATSGHGAAALVPLAALLAEADVISLHCPLTAENTGMINAESIAAMKDGVILLNTARGPLVNEADLAAALESGKVYAAGLDVVSAEPIRADNPLLKAKTCFITPHIAWAPRESRARLMDIAVENLRAFMAGRPVNVVNG